MDDKINSTFEKKLRRGRTVLNYLNARGNRCLLDKGCKWAGENFSLALNEIYLFQILEVTFEEKAPRKEAIENILGTLRGMEGISFIYLIYWATRRASSFISGRRAINLILKKNCRSASTTWNRIF